MEGFNSVFLGPADRVSVRPRQDTPGVSVRFGPYGELSVYLNPAQETSLRDALNARAAAEDEGLRQFRPEDFPLGFDVGAPPAEPAPVVPFPARGENFRRVGQINPDGPEAA